MTAIATQNLPHEEGIPQGGQVGGGEISIIGNTPVLTAYAQEMLDNANGYVAAMKLFAAEPGETAEDDQETVTSEESGEDPAHHNGNPAGYPNGEA